ncbi:TIGR01244 family phosphatase [Methylobacillus gramineus]|uniref:TIGR01244 family sulfur transferase n=1 Tax=Methylobacillus gramineus TaxID=755169 RepID=UPI001CFF78FB|nr:TIGR01244 family sulfur transferase [Methylobacillus gramineus]MCB5184576.1 TIGR01244 family phosphatase [Methylobacillus gramineus]
MAINIKTISDSFSSCAQLSVEQVAEAAEAGFKTIVNNRPDGEGGAEQPASADIRKAAEAAGLVYVHIPVVPGQMTDAQVSELADQLPALPQPILGFCKGGMRATNIYQQALAKNGA